MYEDGVIRVEHCPGRAPTIQVMDTGPLQLYEAARLAERLGTLVRIGLAIDVALLVVVAKPV